MRVATHPNDPGDGIAMMDIIVCVKQVVDPEAEPVNFKVDSGAKRMTTQAGVKLVVDPYAEYAVEAALKIKDAKGGKVTAISLGPNQVRDVVKKPLAMGADDLVLLEDMAFADGDSWSTAYALATAIKKIGRYDLILCGRESSDWNAGQVGSGIGEILGLPSVTLATGIGIDDAKATVKRIAGDGYEVLEVSLPAVITVSNEIGTPRYSAVSRVLAAAKKQPIIWKPAEIGVTAAQIGALGRRMKLVKLFQPVHEGRCQIAEGKSPEEAAVNLFLKLREAKVL